MGDRSTGSVAECITKGTSPHPPTQVIICGASRQNKLISVLCLANFVRRPTKQMYI